MRNTIEEFLRKPAFLLIIFTWLFYLIALYLFNQVVWDTALYHQQWTGNGSFEKYLSIIRKMDILYYALSVLYVPAIIFLIFIAFKTGMLFLNETIQDSRIFKIAIISSIILYLPLWTRVIWFLIIKNGYISEEVISFNPLSITYFFDNLKEMPMGVVKVWRFINLFQLLFILFSAYFIKISTSLSYLKSCFLVLITYGSGLILMVAVRLVIA